MSAGLKRFAHTWREPDAAHARSAAAAAWHQTGIVLINPEWLGWVERQQLINLAEKLHGKRKA